MNSRSLCTAFVAVGLAACSREPGVGLTTLRGVLASQRGGPAMMPNGVAYGAGGLRPATGRSGSAAIQATATEHLGTTTLTVISFGSSDPQFQAPVGDIDKVQVKAFDTTGALLWTRNFNGLAPDSDLRQFTFTGLVPHDRLQVRANVKNIDPRRTDVVVASAAVVAHAPNLAVGSVQVTSRWYLGAPFAVSAAVSETGGDVSVRTSCALYIDGALADRISNMLVLAGDRVTCNFTASISTIGTHAVEVAVENMVPGDENPLDNQSFAHVDIYSQTPGSALLPVFNYTATVGDLVLGDYDTTTTTVTNLAGGLVSHTAVVNADTGRNQNSVFNGFYNGQVTFPVASLVLSQRTAGTSLDSTVLTNLPQNGVGTIPCTDGLMPGGISYSLCSYPAGYTILNYTRNAGTVAYRSQSYNLAFDPALCTSADGCWVSTSTLNTGSVVPFSGSLNFAVALTVGDTSYSAAPSIPLVAIDSLTAYGPSCGVDTVNVQVPGPFGVTITVQQVQNTCVAGHSTRIGVVGSASGRGVTQLTTSP